MTINTCGDLQSVIKLISFSFFKDTPIVSVRYSKHEYDLPLLWDSFCSIYREDVKIEPNTSFKVTYKTGEIITFDF